jgi:hypothetical protein
MTRLFCPHVNRRFNKKEKSLFRTKKCAYRVAASSQNWDGCAAAEVAVGVGFKGT